MDTGKIIDKRRGIVARHGRAIAEIAFVSALGIVATTAFQLITIRGLGPETYGVLAAAIALINVAAIGSSALRNSVAVTTAESVLHRDALTEQPSTRRRLDGSLIEALALGVIGTIGVFLLAPVIASPGPSGVLVVVLTAAAILPNFLFARAQGRLQGEGDSRSVVWWSSGAQIAQALLALLAVLIGADAILILAILVVTAAAGALGAGLQARRDHLPSRARAFTRSSTIVLLLTVAFAWLTNADVVFVRALTPPTDAGAYAAAAVLIKTTLIIPATLSLYLLPRFVHSRGDAAKTSLGVNVILGVTVLSGIAMFLVMLLFGDLIVGLLYGKDYSLTQQLVVPFALAWIPWALAQAVLVRITAASSRTALGAVLAIIVVQAGLALLTLPSIPLWLTANGIAGLVLFGALFAVHVRLLRRGSAAESPDETPGPDTAPGSASQAG